MKVQNKLHYFNIDLTLSRTEDLVHFSHTITLDQSTSNNNLKDI